MEKLTVLNSELKPKHINFKHVNDSLKKRKNLQKYFNKHTKKCDDNLKNYYYF